MLIRSWCVALSALTENDIRQYQIVRLRETIAYVSRESPFYRKRLEGFSAEDIRNVGDLAHLPCGSHIFILAVEVIHGRFTVEVGTNS